MIHKGTSKHSHPGILRYVVSAIDFDPFHTAAGRLSFEDKAMQVFCLELSYSDGSPLLHPVGMVNVCFAGHQARAMGFANKTHGFPGNRKAAFHFRTNRDKFKEISEGVGYVTVVLVTSVISHFLAQQAGTDSNFDW